MKRIKILFISHSSSIGGGEKCLLTLVKYIDRSAFDPVVVFPCEGPLLDEINNLEVATYVSPLEWWIRLPWDFGLERSDISTRLANMNRIIEQEKPDLIHTNTSVIWEGALSAGIKGIPHIWHIHEILHGHPSFKSLFPLPLIYWIMDLLSDRIVAVSNAVKRNFVNQICPEKLLTIYNGIEAQESKGSGNSSIREKLCIPDGAIVAVSIGSIIREKGYDNLIEAVSLVKKEGANARFLVVGDGHPEAVKLLKRRIEDFHLRDYVHYLGFQKNVPKILSDSDFLILPSILEAFPLTILEAMAAGKPVIATDCGGPAEMVSDEESGFLIPVNDPIALSQKILRLLKDETKRMKMGAAALKRFHEKFRAEFYVNHFESLYKHLLNEIESGKPLPKDTLFIGALTELYEKLVHISKIDRELHQKEEMIKNITNSWSWKITAPLRWARRSVDHHKN